MRRLKTFISGAYPGSFCSALAIILACNGTLAASLTLSESMTSENGTSLLPSFNITSIANTTSQSSPAAIINSTSLHPAIHNLTEILNTTKSSSLISPAPSDATSKTSISSGGRAVLPSFFYRTPLRVRCMSPRAAFEEVARFARERGDYEPQPPNVSNNIWSRMSNVIEKNIRGKSRDVILGYIAKQQGACAASCRCGPTGGILPVPTYNNPCKSIAAAEICAYIYFCTCYARLRQPDVGEPDSINYFNSLQDFQDAINQIPSSVRLHPDNKGWRWKVDPMFAEYPGQLLGFSDDGINVSPEGEAPYILHGPQDHNQDSDAHDFGEGPSTGFYWQDHSNFGDHGGSGGSGSGGGIVKREVSLQKQEDDKQDT